jgi:hypothetical protein
VHFDVLTVAINRALADANISDLVGTKIYNHIDKDESPPYLRVQWSSVEQLEDKSNRFSSGELTFDYWTEEDGDKTVLQMLDYLHDEFDNQVLALTQGSTNLLCTCTGYNTFLEGDGLSHHGIITFNLLLED